MIVNLHLITYHCKNRQLLLEVTTIIIMAKSKLLYIIFITKAYNSISIAGSHHCNVQTNKINVSLKSWLMQPCTEIVPAQIYYGSAQVLLLNLVALTV